MTATDVRFRARMLLVLGSVVVLTGSFIALESKDAGSTGGPIGESMGVVPEKGDCVFTAYIDGHGTAATPLEAMTQQEFPDENLRSRVVSAREVVIWQMEGSRVDAAFLATLTQSGWFISRRAVAHPCDRASDPVVHNPRRGVSPGEATQGPKIDF